MNACGELEMIWLFGRFQGTPWIFMEELIKITHTRIAGLCSGFELATSFLLCHPTQLELSWPIMPVSSLSVLVQGIIDANVMGGISKYQQAFFTQEFSRQHPEFTDHVYRLKTLILDQVHKWDHIHAVFSITVIICWNFLQGQSFCHKPSSFLSVLP